MRINMIKLRTLHALNPERTARMEDFKNMPSNCALSISARITWMVLYRLSNPTGLHEAESVAERTGQTVEAAECAIQELRVKGYIRHAMSGEKWREPDEEVEWRGELCCWPVSRRKSERSNLRLPPDLQGLLNE